MKNAVMFELQAVRKCDNFDQFCRSRKMLQNETLVAKIGVGTAANVARGLRLPISSDVSWPHVSGPRAATAPAPVARARDAARTTDDSSEPDYLAESNPTGGWCQMKKARNFTEKTFFKSKSKYSKIWINRYLNLHDLLENESIISFRRKFKPLK